MDNNTSKKTNAQTAKPASNNNKRFMFDKENYKWMFIGIAVIVLGFVLMSGSTDIYDTRKLVVSPIVVLIGFGIEIYAIMKTPKED